MNPTPPPGKRQPARKPATPRTDQASSPDSKRSVRQKERFEQLKAKKKGGAAPGAAKPVRRSKESAEDEALDRALDALEAKNRARGQGFQGIVPGDKAVPGNASKASAPVAAPVDDDDLDERLDRLENGAYLDDAAAPLVWDPERVQAQADMFANRLKKRRQHLWKWARRTNVSCFRIYDRDIPELPFQVDEYEKHLHIAQIVRVRSVDEDHARLWTQTMVDAAARALGVEKSKVFIKNRVQQKGNTQYEKTASAGYILKAQENGLFLEVNLSDYLDTGLFLDHRDTRIMAGGLALGARVLNLFSYTGTFSVHAARGGAQTTTSVDMSNTYTQWAERNLALNGFGGKAHRCICDDVLAWIPGAIERKEQYEMIICDPPTFSNSKKMDGVWDIQRDHPWLINQLLRLLSRNGIIIFSNNFRKFKLDTGALKSKYVDDITFKSIPEDFKGKKPHKCYVIKRDS